VDWACASLVGALRKKGGVSLSYLVSESGLARQTVHSHLKHLVEAGLVSREIKGLGRGRPTVLYSLSGRVVEPGASVVSLAFQRLRKACRFEKGGWCKEVRNRCSAENCPLTLRAK